MFAPLLFQLPDELSGPHPPTVNLNLRQLRPLLPANLEKFMLLITAYLRFPRSRSIAFITHSPNGQTLLTEPKHHEFIVLLAHIARVVQLPRVSDSNLKTNLSREIAFEEAEESKLKQCKVNRPNIRICCDIFWDFIRHATEIISSKIFDIYLYLRSRA